MPVELYLDLFSQPCRALYMFAKKANIPFEFKKITLMAGEHYSEEYGKVNALRTIPALRDGDFCLVESAAIMTYLADKYTTADHWYPVDLKKRARVNEYLSWHHMATRTHGVKMFYIKLIVPKVMGEEVPKEKRDAAMEDFEGTLKTIEEKFLQDKPFIIGDQISLADLQALAEIYQPFAAGIDVFKGRPKLSAWRDRVRQAVGPELFDETHQGIMSIVDMMKMVEDEKMQGLKPKIKVMYF